MTAIDTALASLTLVKSFDYRGAAEEWSNTYFFTGDVPTSPASWKTLADAVIVDERKCYDSSTSVIRGIGHKAGDSVAVWGYDYLAEGEAVPGTYDETGAIALSGDTASWVRWSTDALTSRGKPIYLRSYFHPAYSSAADGPDTVASTWILAGQALGDAWIAGYEDGDSVLHHRAGPHGVVGLTAVPSTYTTTRTLERRGRRPTTP